MGPLKSENRQQAVSRSYLIRKQQGGEDWDLLRMVEQSGTFINKPPPILYWQGVKRSFNLEFSHRFS